MVARMVMLLDTSQSIGFHPAMFGLSAWALNTLTVVSTSEKASTPKAQAQKTRASSRPLIRPPAARHGRRAVRPRKADIIPARRPRAP